jgi:hypothetical protein
MSLRPDIIQQEEYRKEKEREQATVGKGLKTAANVGLTYLGARAAPFLSEFIPADLAMKGLKKVAPKVHDFLKEGMEMGLNEKEGFDFLRDKFNQEQEGPNIIRQYDPMLDELLRYLMDNKNLTPRQAAAHAELEPKLKDVIAKIRKDFKTKHFSEVVERAYKDYKKQAAQPQSEQEQPQQTGQAQPEQPPPQNAQGQQAPQGNDRDAALIAAMQKILNM